MTSGMDRRVPFEKGVSRLGIDIGRVISLTDSDHGSGGLSDKIRRCQISDKCVAAVKALVDMFGRQNTYIVSKCGASVQQASVAMLGSNDFYARTGLDPGNAYFCYARSGNAEGELKMLAMELPPYVADGSAEALGFGPDGAKVTDSTTVGKGAVAKVARLTHLIDDRDDCLMSFYREGHLATLDEPRDHGALLHFGLMATDGPRDGDSDGAGAGGGEEEGAKAMWHSCGGNPANLAWQRVLARFGLARCDELDETARAALAARVRTLARGQAENLAKLVAGFDAEEVAMKARIAEAAAAAAAFVDDDELAVAMRHYALRLPADDGGGKKKKKKKKSSSKSKPPEEAIAFKRATRMRKKELLEKQRQERAAFVEALSALVELEALETIVVQEGSKDVDTWIERGGKGDGKGGGKN